MRSACKGINFLQEKVYSGYTFKIIWILHSKTRCSKNDVHSYQTDASSNWGNGSDYKLKNIVAE